MYGLNADKISTWFKILIIIGGLTALLIVVNKSLHNKALKENGCSTVGEVTGSNILMTWYFEYDIEGRNYKSFCRGRYSNVNIGDKYKVYYNCSNPEDSFIDFNQKIPD